MARDQAYLEEGVPCRGQAEAADEKSQALFDFIECRCRGRDSNPASQLEGWKQPRLPEGWGERHAPITLTPD